MKSQKIILALAAFVIAKQAFGANVEPTDKINKIAATQIITLQPFVQNRLANQYKVEKTLKGECFAGSAAIQREDAWRCMVGNLILDPCYLNEGKTVGDSQKELACFKTPLDKRITLLKATLEEKNANKKVVAQEMSPWAVELANKTICTMLTGATFAINGERINYGCENGDNIVGDLERTAPLWQANIISKEQLKNFSPVAAAKEKIPLHKANVIKVWY